LQNPESNVQVAQSLATQPQNYPIQEAIGNLGPASFFEIRRVRGLLTSPTFFPASPVSSILPMECSSTHHKGQQQWALIHELLGMFVVRLLWTWTALDQPSEEACSVDAFAALS